MVNQTTEPLYYVREDENGTMTTTFTEKYSHVIRFQTIISCDGCPDDEAFASEYPASFGGLDDGESRRALRFDGENARPLSAGLVLSQIEEKISTAIPDIGRIGEATILTESEETAKHMRSSYYAPGGGYGPVSSNERERMSAVSTCIFRPFLTKTISFLSSFSLG